MDPRSLVTIHARHVEVQEVINASIAMLNLTDINPNRHKFVFALMDIMMMVKIRLVRNVNIVVLPVLVVRNVQHVIQKKREPNLAHYVFAKMGIMMMESINNVKVVIIHALLVQTRQRV